MIACAANLPKSSNFSFAFRWNGTEGQRPKTNCTTLNRENMQFITTNYPDCYRLTNCSLPANKSVSIGFWWLGLRFIADDFLHDYPFIDEIELDWNKISHIGRNAFTNRSILKIKLTNNELSDMSVFSATCRG